RAAVNFPPASRNAPARTPSRARARRRRMFGSQRGPRGRVGAGPWIAPPATRGATSTARGEGGSPTPGGRAGVRCSSLIGYWGLPNPAHAAPVRASQGRCVVPAAGHAAGQVDDEGLAQKAAGGDRAAVRPEAAVLGIGAVVPQDKVLVGSQL